MPSNDTIAAIATPAGVGGVAMVRMSGADALAIALKHLSVGTLHPHRAIHCRFADLDDGIATYYPRGYTGEPTVEFTCHGSLYVQQALLQALLDSGARLAEPGEFTRRAFANGKMNLSQAEAVADLIDAVTPAQHRLAVSQLRGGYAQQLAELRARLVELTALLELELDFSQEDVEFADRSELNALVHSLQHTVGSLTASFKTGQALKRGIAVAIVGRPNAGKSSLLNALLADERAIVSDIPGTTRDTIEELLTLDGITFRFIDTAGLRESTDPIEALGLERSIKAAQQAHIILFVRNIADPFDNQATDDIASITARCDMSEKHLLVVHNKCDLPHQGTPQGLIVSAKEHLGIEELKKTLAQVAKEYAGQNSGILLANARHYDALLRVADSLQHVAEGLEGGMPTDLVAVDLRDALYHLGTITGEVTGDEVLSTIFGRFCIGK